MNLRKFSFEVIAELTTGFTRFADRGITRHKVIAMKMNRRKVFRVAVSEDIILNNFMLIAIAPAFNMVMAIVLRSYSYKCFAEIVAFCSSHHAYHTTTFAVFNFKISTCCANGFIHRYSTMDIV